MSERIQAWSCGGGRQSAAIGALICQGKLPAPDIAVIVDTEREKSSTWAYYDGVLRPALSKAGVDLIRVPKSQYATVDLYSLKESRLLIPAFTRKSGELGKLPTYCSNEWKARVFQRFLSDKHPSADFDIWLGISREEAHRMKVGTGKWQYKHPLIDRLLSAENCISIVREHGWPPAPRSCCYMCPQMSEVEWNEMHTNDPEDYARAVAFDNSIRTKDSDVYVHFTGVPLEQNEKPEADLFKQGGECMSGMCFT